MTKKIFISYSWNDYLDVNDIDSVFSRFGIVLSRDIRNLEYNRSIHKFMDTIKDCDKIIIYLTDSYLRSVNCMYEAAQALSIKNKVVVIVKEGTKVFSVKDKEDLVSYWRNAYETIASKDPFKFKDEIIDTKIAYDVVAEFIDFVKNDKRMSNKTLDFESLLKFLEVEKEYPQIISKDVLDWIYKYPKLKLFDVLSLINDLYKSTKIVLSQYPNIPDNETEYKFVKIEFSNNINGVNLVITVQNVDSGTYTNIHYSNLVEIEENTNRSDTHSKYYFYCENLSDKQRCKELEDMSKYRILTDEENKIKAEGYLDVFRIIINFESSVY